jgi:UDP-4-amino-4,6-dideoxy-N-acetyl-beta-L-altrosamine transaminase
MAGFLPYGRQTIAPQDIAAVAEALEADYLTTGPRVDRFEQAFAERVGAAHAVACANGTAALHLAMLALRVGEGDAVVVPSVTFLATANCARFVGAEVVFADVDPESGLMTPQTLREALARADRPVRAALPVHLRGEVCDLPGLEAAAREAGAVLVEDAAHALGSEASFAGTTEGATEQVGDVRHSAMACFSFHPVKTIATGEGGMVTTNDPDLAQRLARLRSHGMVREPDGDPTWYEMPELGFNYRLPDVLCALGLSQLARLDGFVERRRALAAAYAAALAPLAPLARLAARPAWSRPVLHLMTVLVDFAAAGVGRREVVERLRLRGIGSQVHYIPVHRQPYYRARYGELELAGADAWYDRCLSLPLYPTMTEGDVTRVVQALREALGA